MLTKDDFLGGKVQLFQEAHGLRATSDSVLLAAAVPARSGDSVLDVGTGNGVVALCLASRVQDLNLTGLDCQQEVLSLAERNAKENNVSFTSVLANVSDRPSLIHGQQFHHVVTNPPFYDEPHARHDSQTARAYQQSIPLSEWLAFCLRHIRAKGSLTLIHRPEALPEILTTLDGKIGAIEVIPVMSKADKNAKRILVRARMNSRKRLSICPPLIMHKGNGERTEVAEKLLRMGIGLDDLL